MNRFTRMNQNTDSLELIELVHTRENLWLFASRPLPACDTDCYATPLIKIFFTGKTLV